MQIQGLELGTLERFRICSRLAGVTRARPPQSSQVFCRNGKRDSTLPVALHVGQSVSVGAFVAMRGSCTRNVPQPRHLLQLHPGLRPLEQLLAPDRRGSTGTMAFRAEPGTVWEPAAGHTAAALADWANIVGGFNATSHAWKYRPRIPRREAVNG